MPFLGRSLLRRLRTALYYTLAIFLLAFVPFAGPPKAGAKSKLARESDLKAVFIFNFAQFTEWPAEAFAEETAPFVIGVLGEDPVVESLKEITSNESIRNRSIVVRQYRDVREIDRCHILFISETESPRLERILSVVKGRAILTVGETDEFSAHDGMIQFLVADHKLRLRINVEAAKAERLTISSKLLRQAEIVDARQGQ